MWLQIWRRRGLYKSKAIEILKECGYEGEQIPLYTSKKYKMMYDQAVVVQSELAAVSINIKLEVVDLPVLIKKYISGDYQILSFGVGVKPDPVLAYLILSGFFLSHRIIWKKLLALFSSLSVRGS